MKKTIRTALALISAAAVLNGANIVNAASGDSCLVQAYNNMEKAVINSYEYGWEEYVEGMTSILEKLDIDTGVLGGRIGDFDLDGQNELLVLKLLPYTSGEIDGTGNPAALFGASLEMYEEEGGKAVLKDTTEPIDVFNRRLDKGGLISVVKDGKIALQSESQNNTVADGASSEISIYAYGNGNFEKIVDYSVGGSAIHGNPEYAEKFYDAGFTGTSEYIGQLGFSPYLDEFDILKLEKNSEGIYSLYIDNNRDYESENYEEVSKNLKMTLRVEDHSNINDLNEKSDISVIFNGSEMSFDSEPYIEQGTTMVPMRAIFEALGASVEWNGETQTVTSVKGDTTVFLTINNNTAVVNGKEISLVVPATIVNGRTMVPLRFVSESLGAEVNWDGTNRTVTINN